MLLTRPPDFAAPVARGLRARPEWALQGGLPKPGPGEDHVAGTEVPPLWGPGADEGRYCGPGDRLPGRPPRGWRVLLHEGIHASAASLALSDVPAKQKSITIIKK